jgi:cytochrome b involved in lipid metabolism
MNDSTLPRQVSPSPLASKEQQSSSSSARRKVGRFGMADWTRLLANSKDLAQRKGQPLRRIRWEEIRQHASVHDGWIVLKNKVYNISPYMVYHPGGESILKPVLGKDATPLFDKYHRWINEEGYVLSLDERLQTVAAKPSQSPTRTDTPVICRAYCPPCSLLMTTCLFIRTRAFAFIGLLGNSTLATWTLHQTRTIRRARTRNHRICRNPWAAKTSSPCQCRDHQSVD